MENRPEGLIRTEEEEEEEEEEATASVVLWSEFLATDPEVPGSIPGASRFSERQWVWNGVHSAS
jgi:hypothetical protein